MILLDPNLSGSNCLLFESPSLVVSKAKFLG